MIYRRCLHLLRDAAAAEDATQEVFVRFMTHAADLAEQGGYAPWIYRVATNHCLNVLRDEARLEVRDPQLLPEAGREGEAAGLPERDLSMKILRRFDEDTRAIAVLALVDGLNQDEIAEIVGMSRKTVGKKLQRFLERSHKFLARESRGAA